MPQVALLVEPLGRVGLVEQALRVEAAQQVVPQQVGLVPQVVLAGEQEQAARVPAVRTRSARRAAERRAGGGESWSRAWRPVCSLPARIKPRFGDELMATW